VLRRALRQRVQWHLGTRGGAHLTRDGGLRRRPRQRVPRLSGSHRNAGPGRRHDAADPEHRHPDDLDVLASHNLQPDPGRGALRCRRRDLCPGTHRPDCLRPRWCEAAHHEHHGGHDLCRLSRDLTGGEGGLPGPRRTSCARSTSSGGKRSRDTAFTSTTRRPDPRAGERRTGFGGLGASGKVTAVNSASFTIESSRPQDRAATPAVSVTRTVETSPATAYTRTRAADARALAVGLCVTALGRTDDTGSMAATSIMLRPPENGSCSSGLGRREPILTPAGGGPGA